MNIEEKLKEYTSQEVLVFQKLLVKELELTVLTMYGVRHSISIPIDGNFADTLELGLSSLGEEILAAQRYRAALSEQASAIARMRRLEQNSVKAVAAAKASISS